MRGTWLGADAFVDGSGVYGNLGRKAVFGGSWHYRVGENI
jgi:hypothetical protein